MTPLVNLWSLKSWWGRRERVRQRMRLLKKGSVQKHAQRRRLPFSPTEHNDCLELELWGAWEPLCSHCPLSLGEGKSSQLFVSHGDEAYSR